MATRGASLPAGACCCSCGSALLEASVPAAAEGPGRALLEARLLAALPAAGLSRALTPGLLRKALYSLSCRGASLQKTTCHGQPASMHSCHFEQLRGHCLHSHADVLGRQLEVGHTKYNVIVTQ
jgi:hypothetical protein